VIEIVRRVVTVLCVVLSVAVVAPAAAVGPPRGVCDWAPELLPLPPHTLGGQVTGGDGAWLAGVAYDPNEGLLWHEGRLAAHGQAFGLDTGLHAVNAAGVAVGGVTGVDGRRHAVRYETGYRYLPETAGSSIALDVNAGGEAVGYDGATLVVWPARGPARILSMPPDAAPYGHPAIDDDGTVVARTGRVEGTTMRWQVYAWAPSGTREPLPAGDVRDVRHGRAVGTAERPAGDVAAAWSLDGGPPRVYPGGVSVTAVNRSGVLVGAGPSGEPLLWAGRVPMPLPSPPGYHPGSVTAINDREAGGFVSPLNELGTAPVRWLCR
jgi:hypothetical protein